ncbi:hypothetical protein G6F55_013317 [Rhizopus delemar]|nr:hypothetical protein G6F55_013317 [Rhizopus delemar]
MAAAPSGKVTRIHHRPPADDTESLDGQLQRLRRDVVGMNTVLCGGREGQQQPCGDGHPPSSDRMRQQLQCTRGTTGPPARATSKRVQTVPAPHVIAMTSAHGRGRARLRGVRCEATASGPMPTKACRPRSTPTRAERGAELPRCRRLAGQLALHPIIDQALFVAQRIAVAPQPQVVQVAAVAQLGFALIDDAAAGVLQRVLQARLMSTRVTSRVCPDCSGLAAVVCT